MRITLARLALSIVLTLAISVLFAPAAFAASSETTPVAVGDLDVQLWPGAAVGQGVAILALTLPEDAKLPARVRIPVPAGATVDWAGEIGDDSSGDIERPRTVQQGPNGAYAEFDLVASRFAQLEVSGLPLANDNGTYSIKLDYVQSVPAGVTGFSVRLPSGATDASIAPAPSAGPDKNEVGETLYTLSSAELKDGESRTITASYRLGGAPAGQPASATSSKGTLLGVLLGVLVLVAVVLVVVMKRERSA